MKQLSFLFVCISVVLSCSQPVKHKAGIIKTDTIIAEYITAPYGNLQGGGAVRVVSYKEKITTLDSINFVKSVELDTTCTVYVQQPLLDSLTKRQKKDSLGNLLFRTVPYYLPGRFVRDTYIPTH